MSAIGRTLERVIDAIAIVAFSGVFLCIFAQIISRYIFSSPLVWSEELARYLFIWVAFLGWLIASRHSSHLAMSFLSERFGERATAITGTIIHLATLAFAIVMVRRGLHLVANNWDVETVTLPASMGAVYLIVPLAGLGIGAYALRDLGRILRPRPPERTP